MEFQTQYLFYLIDIQTPVLDVSFNSALMLKTVVFKVWLRVGFDNWFSRQYYIEVVCVCVCGLYVNLTVRFGLSHMSRPGTHDI